MKNTDTILGVAAVRPSIDHSILSPSGRVSKRVREAAMKRANDILFPAGFWDAPKKSESEVNQEKALRLHRSAINLRGLASRGMHPRKYIKEAERMETEALALFI